MASSSSFTFFRISILGASLRQLFSSPSRPRSSIHFLRYVCRTYHSVREGTHSNVQWLLQDPNYVYGHLDQDIMKKIRTALGEVSPYIHRLKAASSNRCVCYASILLRTIGSFGLKPSPTVSCYGSYFGSCVDLFRCAWSPCDMVGWCCAYFIATSPPLPNSRLRA